MKTSRLTKHLLSTLSLVTLSCLLTTTTVSCAESHETTSPSEVATTTESQKIKIALLLDTSNSMDGLIDQAKSQLWQLVNQLAETEGINNQQPSLEIALYEYGNSNLPSTEGYIRMVTQLTNDLDLISQDLFSLRTNGGSEFCGQVIETATKELDWARSDNDLQIIFIAGNEPFTQGSINYNGACLNAKEQGIFVNTIFCGDYNDGINTNWKNGADLTDGTYMSIQQNNKTVFIESPYDDQISDLNAKLNATYYGYGSLGVSKKQNQIAQDNNASSYSKANSVQRTVSKSKHVYSNSSWDIVDAHKNKTVDITKLKESQLPKEMKGMSGSERVAFVQKQQDQRAKITKEIQDLNIKRQEYVTAKKKELGESSGMLDQAMIKALSSQAKTKNMTLKGI